MSPRKKWRRPMRSGRRWFMSARCMGQASIPRARLWGSTVRRCARPASVRTTLHCVRRKRLWRRCAGGSPIAGSTSCCTLRHRDEPEEAAARLPQGEAGAPPWRPQAGDRNAALADARSRSRQPTAASGTNDLITRCSRRSQSVRRATISWDEDYNHHGPCSALANLLPAQFATKSALESVPINGFSEVA